MTGYPIRYQLIPMTEEHGPVICSWRYPAPYDLYNWNDWKHMLSRGEEFADPFIRQTQYRAVVDEAGSLCGFAQLFPMAGLTRLGLGMRPDLCGAGQGERFVRAIAEEARRLQPEHEIDLEVLIWNKRAIRVYEKAGFAITDTYERMTLTGMDTFHCMVWNETKPEAREQAQ
ncbi:GNAT family N-acetyltransferase [Paenibacillus allorhizosphaerae]|uniref:N-acetyltransferase domain-containing protein n=1 Tax=Paenibacillus allorhizosphaerae TaxID=2849866 RepID=A0ABM8VPL6_9BACL|nr:GNAT family N-acetyltransferase [Paenibacillus allorhizosphaerae]CAG7653078.1 hypothetical protein PAECIP111802_05390 [Paenibacillus allorhizosphaerae]